MVDKSAGVFVLTDAQYADALVVGASQLGVIPADILPRVRRVQVDLVSNGAVLQVWLSDNQAPPPPPDAEDIRAALKDLGLVVPTVKQIARWSREQLEQVARWALSAARADGSEPSLDMPNVLSDLQQRRRRGRNSDAPPSGAVN